MAARTADRETGPGGLVERLWSGRAGLAGSILGPLLTPLEAAFRGAVALRNVAYRKGLLRSHPAPVPAISVGNLSVGGTGKTPLVRWIVSRLQARGCTPGILHGGYSHDEPALHRQWFPTLPVVADRDRVRAAATAAAAGADVVVLDDAFQHRRIRRELDVVVVAAERWGPRPRLLPRGPYREPPRALRRADLVVVTRRTAGPDDGASVARSVREWTAAPVVVARLTPAGWLTSGGASREGSPERGVAVAGIGRPEAFFRHVAELGVELDARLVYRDHHDYTEADADRIRTLAEGRAVITTAKDAIRLRPLVPETDLWVLDQTVTFDEGEEAVMAALEETAR